MRYCELCELVTVHRSFVDNALFCVDYTTFEVSIPRDLAPQSTLHPDTTCWIEAGHQVGDAAHLYNPKFLTVTLAVAARNAHFPKALDVLSRFPIPAINFTTDEWTRRSMTLNGMRMSLESFATDSERIKLFIHDRMVAGQLDVVHDVLVYLMHQVLDARAAEREERQLRASALAAFLGIDSKRMEPLMLSPTLSASFLSRQIKDGEAGPVRRNVDIETLVINQLQLLEPALSRRRDIEEKHVKLMSDLLEIMQGTQDQKEEYSLS